MVGIAVRTRIKVRAETREIIVLVFQRLFNTIFEILLVKRIQV